MMHFMICDTDTKCLERLATVLHQLYDPCSVEYMYGPDVLEVSLRSASGAADILLTEIELRERRSIDIIRRYQAASDPLQIIYMTSNIEYCFDVYDTHHSGFLLKPLEEHALRKSVDRALADLHQRKSQGLAVRQGKNVYIISFSNLQRVESQGRTIHLFAGQEEIVVYGKVDALLSKVDKRFLRCHKSHLINMDHVQQYTGDSFCMRDGGIVPISQSKRKEVRDRFLSYVGLTRDDLQKTIRF